MISLLQLTIHEWLFLSLIHFTFLIKIGYALLHSICFQASSCLGPKTPSGLSAGLLARLACHSWMQTCGS